jgi:hypothetical protein
MYKCNLCNKKFNYESKFIIHKNRKNICNICNLKFKCPFDKNKHEKTKKHIYNINLQNNNINELKTENTENIELKNENEELKNKNIELIEIIKNLENEFNLLKQLSNK